ncbi:MAG: hypothetical protein GF370_01165 [Candidatus Nealsonbacteria bacterium]|nr:hypothetical protein [Candidatus Nealsonbacteria bacterium]
MEKYKVLDHKADLIIRGYGRTKKELFTNLLRGMMESQEPDAGHREVKREIKAKSSDSAALLVDFLNEALSLAQTHKEFYSEFEEDKLKETEIQGMLIGKAVKGWGKEIKAATYHELKISQKKGGKWEAQVIFDV